jgi:hypothetical protein
MKLFRVLATINIAALVKSSSAGYSLVGTEQCLDSFGNPYDHVDRNLQPHNITAAYEWCLTATAVKSKLVGVEIDNSNGDWYCDYDNGSINSIHEQDFNPHGSFTFKDNSGTGAIASIDSDPTFTCWRNDVRPNNSN